MPQSPEGSQPSPDRGTVAGTGVGGDWIAGRPSLGNSAKGKSLASSADHQVHEAIGHVDPLPDRFPNQMTLGLLVSQRGGHDRRLIGVPSHLDLGAHAAIDLDDDLGLILNQLFRVPRGP